MKRFVIENKNFFVGMLVGVILVLIIILSFVNSDIFGNVADWASGIGTFVAIIISVKITKKQIIADKEKDRENYFRQRDYETVDRIHEKIIENQIFIENSAYTLRVTIFNDKDEQDTQKFWNNFIESYLKKYTNCRENNNYLRRKISEYSLINGVIANIESNEMKRFEELSSVISNQNVKLNNYLVTHSDVFFPDKEKLINILTKYAKGYKELSNQILEVKKSFREQID